MIAEYDRNKMIASNVSPIGISSERVNLCAGTSWARGTEPAKQRYEKPVNQ